MSSTLIHSFDKNGTYPTYVSITATHHCGTVSIQLPDEFTEQMSYELPSINIDVYTSVNDTLVLYRERALVVPVDMEHKDSTYSIIDIPKQCIFAITPLYDDDAYRSHNRMAEVFEESEWTTRTTEFPLTLIWSDVNVVAGGGNSGGSGTTDYDELENKPQINDIELSGNKTSHDLGLQSELTEAQQNAVDSGIDSTKVAQIATNTTAISGKQDTIDSSHKLSADLVDDTNTTHKFATAAQLTQIATNTTAIGGKQDTIDSNHMLSADLVDDTSTTNKFATAEQLTQIGTNANNITSLQNGAKFVKDNDGYIAIDYGNLVN